MSTKHFARLPVSPTIIVKTTTPRYIGLCLHVCLGSEGCGFYVAFCIASGGSTKRGLQPPWAQSFPQKFNGLKYNSKAFVSVNIYNFMSHHMVAQNKKKKKNAIILETNNNANANTNAQTKLN